MKQILIIGAGGIGNRHIRGFLKTGRAALSIVEPDPVKARRAGETYPVEQVWNALEDADLPAFDGAVVCAPANVHIPIGDACARAGLPFLMEKPLAVTADGVQDLIDRVDAAGLPAYVAYVFRSALETQALKSQIEAGRIGAVMMCLMNASQEYPKYRPDYRDIYYAREASGGGAVLDSGSHLFDLVLWLLGPVCEVGAMYDHLQLEGVEVEDTCLITLRCAGGAMVQICINQFQKPNTRTIEVVGTEGNLRIDGSVLEFANDDSGHWIGEDYMKGQTPLEAHENRFALQADRFLDALEGKQTSLATLAEAFENLRIALAAKESYKSKRIISLPVTRQAECRTVSH